MYMSFGFKYVDKVEITYVDIGVPRKFYMSLYSNQDIITVIS